MFISLFRSSTAKEVAFSPCYLFVVQYPVRPVVAYRNTGTVRLYYNSMWGDCFRRTHARKVPGDIGAERDPPRDKMLFVFVQSLPEVHRQFRNSPSVGSNKEELPPSPLVIFNIAVPDRHCSFDPKATLIQVILSIPDNATDPHKA